MKTKKSRKHSKKLSSWQLAVILLIPFILLFLYGLNSAIKSDTELDENEMFTVGKVVRTYRLKSRGDFIRYEFTVNGKVYRDNQSIDQDVTRGDCYVVRYSSISPRNCKMVLSRPVACDTIIR